MRQTILALSSSLNILSRNTHFSHKCCKQILKPATGDFAIIKAKHRPRKNVNVHYKTFAFSERLHYQTGAPVCCVWLPNHLLIYLKSHFPPHSVKFLHDHGVAHWMIRVFKKSPPGTSWEKVHWCRLVDCWSLLLVATVTSLIWYPYANSVIQKDYDLTQTLQALSSCLYFQFI